MGRDRIHEGRRQINLGLFLRRAYRRNYRRASAGGRETRDSVIYLLARVFGKRGLWAVGGTHQRSISPKTISCEPMMATTSANIWPSTISLSAARCAKLGARHLSR